MSDVVFFFRFLNSEQGSLEFERSSAAIRNLIDVEFRATALTLWARLSFVIFILTIDEMGYIDFNILS